MEERETKVERSEHRHRLEDGARGHCHLVRPRSAVAAARAMPLGVHISGCAGAPRLSVYFKKRRARVHGVQALCL